MINVLLPTMGESSFFKESYFPKPLIEIKGMTMLEMVINNYKQIKNPHFIFVLGEDDCRKFHLDSSVKILSPTSEIIKLAHQTAGALCSCLMAIEYVNNEEPLIIANSDQIIDVDYLQVLDRFYDMSADAGVITFPNIHPRWSYAKKMEEEVVEVAEKKPISRDAIAGFYYYKRGSDFVQSAESALMKRNDFEGKYYISASINELILMGKKVVFYDIEKEKYHSFYSPSKIKEYEEGIKHEII